MARQLPSGTPYIGPTMNFDDQMDTDSLIRRLAYGKAAPLLGHRERTTGAFFGKLIDALSNAHVVLVKTSVSEWTCRSVATLLRKELPSELYGVVVDHDRYHSEWNVLVFNRVRIEHRQLPTKFIDGGPNWIGIPEVARVLRIGEAQARRVIHASSLKIRRGMYNQILIRQRDLPILANRPGRWKRRAKSA